MWVAGTHMAVLTPVAGVRTANTGHAPGEGSGFRNNRESYTTRFSPTHKMHWGTNEVGRQNLHKSHNAHQDWTEVGTELTLKVLETATLQVLYIQEHLSIPRPRDRFWTWYSRLEGTAVVEDKVNPSKPHTSLHGEQLQLHSMSGPCSKQVAITN